MKLRRPRSGSTAPAATTPPVEEYRTRPEHLHDAGGAYLVLPYSLLRQLPAAAQQALVDAAEAVRTSHRTWAAVTTYQVLPWQRVRVRDLAATDLAWHGITSDVHPGTGELSYHRGGAPLHPQTIAGHRPALDIAPPLPGAVAGARPALLPSTPTELPGTQSAGRSARAQRLVDVRDRQHRIIAVQPIVSPQWAAAIAATDTLWGPDEEWRDLLTHTTAEIPPEQPADDLDVDDNIHDPQAEQEAALPAAELATETEVDQQQEVDELARLEADLADLYRP